MSIQGKACKDLSESILHRKPYVHNKRFKHAFENLKQSLEKLRSEQQYDQVWINALFALYQNLKSIDAQLRNLETERNIKLDKSKHIEQQLKDDDLKSWDDIVIRIKQHLTPESVLFPPRHSFVDCAVDWLYFCASHQHSIWLLDFTDRPVCDAA